MTQMTPDMAATQTARPGERAPFEPPESGEGPKTAADRTVTGLSHTVLIIWSILIILPLIWVFMSSFKTSSEIFASPFALPQRWSFDNYVNAWTTAGIGSFFFNSVIVVFGALILTMTFGSMSAYVLARFSFPGNRALYYLMLAGLTFPIFLAIVPLFFVLRGIGLLNTLPGLIVTYAAFAFPFTVFFLYAFFRSLSKSIAEAAAVDGAGEWRTFFQIMLPMARPGLATVAILNFVGLWNQFLLPDRPEHQPRQLRPHPGDGVLRLPGRLLGGLRGALRRRGDHRRTGVDHLSDLPAAAPGVGVARNQQVARQSAAGQSNTAGRDGSRWAVSIKRSCSEVVRPVDSGGKASRSKKPTSMVSPSRPATGSSAELSSRSARNINL